MGATPSKPRLYAPLGKRHIRLVSIDRSDPAAQTISCRLTTCHLDDAPPYKALSYAWGDPKVTSAITINGLSVQKTTNLVGALRQLRESDDAKYWIDAICIDQHNNAEKSEQVQLMGEIYGNAVEVTAWLGETTDDSDLAMTFLSQWVDAGLLGWLRRKQFKDNISASTEEERERKMAEFERTPDMRDLIRNSLNKILHPFEIHEWRALAELVRRPYWKRIWIIQELTLARKVTLRCGQAGCSYHSVQPMASLMWECRIHNVLVCYGVEDFETVTLHILEVHSRLLPTIMAADRATANRNNLPTLLPVSVRSLATDPRDKVYALLSLVPAERTTIIVDYSRTPVQVYTDFVLSEIRLTGTLTPLYMLEENESKRATKKLPSWVPDLCLETSFPSIWNGPSDFRAAGQSKASYDVSWNRKKLSVHGVRLCAIEQVDIGAVRDAGVTKEAVVSEILPRWFALAKSRPAADTPPGFNLAQTFFRTINNDESNTGPPDCNPRGLSKIDALADKTMNYVTWSGQNLHVQGPPPIDLAPFLSVVASGAAPDGTPGWLDDSRPPVEMAMEQAMDNVGMKAQRFAEDFTELAAWSSFFVSKDGYMGTGPKRALPGDVVCVLLGAELPVVLRPEGKCFTLVGPCYVCGAMYGQLVKEAAQGLRQFEMFKLV